MAIGDKDHGRIAMAVATMLTGALDQPLDLALGEVSLLHGLITLLFRMGPSPRAVIYFRMPAAPRP